MHECQSITPVRNGQDRSLNSKFRKETVEKLSEILA